MQSIVNIVKSTPVKQIVYGTKTKEQMIAYVTERKSKLSSSFENMDYWQLIDDMCYDFSILILDTQKSKDDNNWKSLEKKYKRVWKNSGSRGKRMAEIESYEIVMDALSLSTSKQALFLKEKVGVLKQVLEKLLVEE